MDKFTINFEFIPTNGIQLHTALAGPENGEPVILLHGFPEAWFGWEKQILALAEAGFQGGRPGPAGLQPQQQTAGGGEATRSGPWSKTSEGWLKPWAWTASTWRDTTGER